MKNSKAINEIIKRIKETDKKIEKLVIKQKVSNGPKHRNMLDDAHEQGAFGMDMIKGGMDGGPI